VAWARPTSPSACPAATNSKPVPADGDGRRADQRDHVHTPELRCSRAGIRPAARSRPVGLKLDRRRTGRARRRCRRPRPPHECVSAQARPLLQRDEPVAEKRGAQRVRLRFLPERRGSAVPSGTADLRRRQLEWIAIDSTAAGHGTCKKCNGANRLRRYAALHVDPARSLPDELRAGWRLAAVPTPRRLGRRRAAAANPAQGGAGRGRPPRHPAARGPEAVTWCSRSRPWRTASDCARARRA